MIAALVLTQTAVTAQAQAQAPAQAQATPPHTISLDWAAMPPVPYRVMPLVTPALTAFVAREVASGRCARPRPADGHYRIVVDVALLIAADHGVRQAVPRAIDCPTVEQYAAGLATSFANGDLLERTVTGERWYRTSVTFDWQA